MRQLLLLLFVCSSILLAAQEANKDQRTNKHIQEQIEREKKYSIEQQFYQGQDYDLKSAEVNMDSVKNLPDVENTYEGYDMDGDYDDN